ncbi:MAG: hypothetical protein PHZ09_05205 [Eubacteriales bacterium]|nr:hypothetical protein [Eubacteriales bacterium]
MRRSMFLSAILFVAIVMTLPLYASGGDVKKGTPVVNGILDDIYLQSHSYATTIENPVYTAGAEYADAADTAAVSYFLWDDNYFYVCTTVTDSTLLSVGAEALNAADYTWQNDVCEMWWNVGGIESLVNLDAFGHRITGSPTVTGEEGYIGQATRNGNSYTVEFAYPNANKAGDIFNYSTQINNILVADASQIVCIGAQKAPYEFKLSAEEVTYPEPETEAPVIESPAEAPKTEAPAAQTLDIAMITVAAMGAAALAFLKAKKKQ